MFMDSFQKLRTVTVLKIHGWGLNLNIPYFHRDLESKMRFSLLDGFKSRSECHSAIRSDGMWCLFLIFASVFGAIKAFKLGNRILQFMDIKNFYHEALGISSGTVSRSLIGRCLRPIRIVVKPVIRKIRSSQLDSNSVKVIRSSKTKSNVYS